MSDSVSESAASVSSSINSVIVGRSLSRWLTCTNGGLSVGAVTMTVSGVMSVYRSRAGVSLGLVGGPVFPLDFFGIGRSLLTVFARPMMISSSVDKHEDDLRTDNL